MSSHTPQQNSESPQIHTVSSKTEVQGLSALWRQGGKRDLLSVLLSTMIHLININKSIIFNFKIVTISICCSPC